MTFRLKQRGKRGVYLALSVAVCLLITALVEDVVYELRRFQAADSDSVHWTLSQAEVAYLQFRIALDTAQHEGTGQADLEELVRYFDIFYSRVATLSAGKLYEPLRGLPEFAGDLARVQDALADVTPLIDQPIDALRGDLPAIAARSDGLGSSLRSLATVGLQYFAAYADESRIAVAITLLRLAVVTALLFLALLFAIRRTRRARRLSEKSSKQLAAAYARLNTVLETSLDAVIIADLSGRILAFNPAAERIFGYRVEEALGQDIGDVILPLDMRESHAQSMLKFRQTGEAKLVGIGRVQLKARRSTGEIFPVEVALQKARAGQDEVIIGFLRDISHRVAAEQELTLARDKALAGERAKAEFLAMMTHEIRTPLNGLLGNLALLGKTDLDAEQLHHVHYMDISGAVLMHHVDAVLDVARFEAGAQDLEQHPVEIGKLLEEIVGSQSGAAATRGNRLRWGWGGEKVDWVLLDAARLRHILLNLVGNAIKFTKDGRIDIEAEYQPKDRETGVLEIRVSDTGIGIAEELQSRIFDDFETLGTLAGGTGLGLGIVRRFVSALGGDIGVESAPDEGSTFWLRLPVSRCHAPGEAAVSQAVPEAHGRRLSILLVEDNEINMDLAQRVLTGLGHRVTTAQNGREAVDAATATKFDLVLMDIRMPVLGGLEATKQIREGGGPNHQVPIIAVSANVLPEARNRFLAAGMSGFLAKPLEEGAVVRAIAAAGKQQPAPLTRTTPAPDRSALLARYRSEVEGFFATDFRMWSLPDLAEAAHRIAGSAAVFGQDHLRSALVSVEIAADSGDAARSAEAVAAARSAWETAPDPSLG